MEAGGAEVHWVEGGTGQPTVFLHGLADCHLSFAPLAGAFRGRRVLLLDLPGHGLSGRPDAVYSPEWYAGVIGAWWDQLGLEDVDLVGHSYGGALAQLMLLSHAERVGTLTLVAPGGLGSEVSFWLRLLTLPRAEQVIGPFLGLGTRLALASVPGSSMSRDSRALAGWYASRPGTARALVRTTRAVIDLAGQHRLVHERVHEAGALPPTAVLWGTHDRILPLRHAELARGWLQGLDVRTYDGCGHWPHLERTAHVARDIERLWSDHGRPAVRVAVERIPRPAWPVRAWRAGVRAARRVFRPRRPLLPA